MYENATSFLWSTLKEVNFPLKRKFMVSLNHSNFNRWLPFSHETKKEHELMTDGSIHRKQRRRNLFMSPDSQFLPHPDKTSRTIYCELMCVLFFLFASSHRVNQLRILCLFPSK